MDGFDESNMNWRRVEEWFNNKKMWSLSSGDDRKNQYQSYIRAIIFANFELSMRCGIFELSENKCDSKEWRVCFMVVFSVAYFMKDSSNPMLVHSCETCFSGIYITPEIDVAFYLSSMHAHTLCLMSFNNFSR